MPDIRRSSQLDGHSSHPLLPFFGLEHDTVAVADFVHKASDMDEYLLIGAFFSDEAVTFGLVEKFDGSFKHWALS